VPKVQWKIPDNGQRNCPKHVEFLDKNKFGILVLMLILLKGIYYDARSHERIILFNLINHSRSQHLSAVYCLAFFMGGIILIALLLRESLVVALVTMWILRVEFMRKTPLHFA
jgi:hypothetical protein